MSRLQEIVKGLKHLTAQEGLTCSPDIILDCAVRIYNTGRINEDEDNKPQESEFKGKLASDKQKSTMTKFHIPFKENISSKDASKLIDTKFKELGIKS